MGIAVLLVGIYLTLNLVVIARGLPILVTHRQFPTNWHDHLFQSHGSPLTMIGVACLMFRNWRLASRASRPAW